MRDPRYQELAHKLVHYSCRLQPGEKLLLEITGHEEALAKEIIREAYAAGGQPYVTITNETLQKEWLLGGEGGISAEAIQAQARWEAARMSEMDAYISLRLKENLYDLAEIPDEVNLRYSKNLVQPVHYDIRVPHTKWVILRYPTPSMAQEAGLPTETFEDHFLRVCNFDYRRLGEAAGALKELLDQADRVEIKAPNVDLSFSIKGIGSVICAGMNNIPDGEVFTAPVKDSVEGSITYNTPSPYQGKVFSDVHLQFHKGQIVSASAAANDAALQAIFNADEGARYIGEFAFGLNPHIHQPIKDILFDEKITGSFHFTPGNCYDDADNGNTSSIHWDLVYILREDYGGGRILVDGELIQENGLFIPKQLQALNPEQLLAE